MISDIFRNSIWLLKLPFLASFPQNFSTMLSNMLSKFFEKSAQKCLILSIKASFEKCLFLFLFLISSGFAAPLTLECSFAIALDQNPRQKAAIEGVLALEENALAAYAPYYPDLWAHAHYRRFHDVIFLPKIDTPFPFTIPEVVGPVNDWAFNVYSRYTLFDSGYRRARLMKAFSNRNLAAEQAETLRQALLLQVADSFFAYLRAQNLLEVAYENFQRAKDHVLISEMRQRVGAVPPLDVYRTKANLAQTELNIYQAKSALKLAQGTLNVSLGLPPESPLELAEDNLCIECLNLEDLFDAAHKYRPEIGAGYEKIAFVEETINEIKSEYGPIITANGLYGRHDRNFFPSTEQWSFGVNIELPLFQGFKTVHGLRRAKHELSQALAELEDTALQIRKDVWESFALLEESQQSIRSSESSLIYADKAYRLAQKRYEAGASTLNDLLDSQAALFEAEQQVVNQRFNASSSYAALLWSAGIIDELLPCF